MESSARISCFTIERMADYEDDIRGFSWSALSGIGFLCTPIQQASLLLQHKNGMILILRDFWYEYMRIYVYGLLSCVESVSRSK
jgi:hypothetical protein